MKIKVLFLAAIILFGVLLFSNVNDRDLPTNKWDMIKEMNDSKATGDSLNCTLLGRALFGNCRAVFIKDTIAYSCHGISLLIFSIKDPVNPILLGYYDMGDYALGVYVIDTIAYVADGNAGLRIINISNPTIPIETGYYNTNYAKSVYVVDTIAYVADGYKGLRIINVSNPTAPVEMGFYDTGDRAIGVYVIDTFIYVTDDDAGLYIIKYPVDGSGIGDERKLNNNVSINNYYIKYNNTTIDLYFGLKDGGELILNIYDKMGRKLKTLNNSIVENGYTKISINRNDYPTGEYFIKGKMGDTEVSAKILIIK